MSMESQGAKCLLILPCNNKAFIGNYFEGDNWKYAMKKVKDKKLDKNKIMFAASDCIITTKNPKNDRDVLGSIVLETEMDRVKGYDEYPSWEKFKKNDYQLLLQHSRYTELALLRLKDNFDLIVLALAVRGYRLSALNALQNLFKSQDSKNIIMINGGDSQGWQKKMTDYAIDLISEFLFSGKIQCGIVEIPNIEITNPKLNKFRIMKDEIPINIRN
jgi:hypothetical protein